MWERSYIYLTTNITYFLKKSIPFLNFFNKKWCFDLIFSTSFLYLLFILEIFCLILVSTNISCYLQIWTKWLFPYFDLDIFFQLFQLDNLVSYFLQSIFQRAVKASKFFIAGTMNKRVKLSTFHIFLMNLLLLIQQKIYILKF